MSAKKARIVKVLVASPGDVAEERAMVEDVINQWNARPLRPLKLEPVLWESSSAPETGGRVQGILNKQIVDLCDFAIGIFWTRIGTNTGRAPGGAVEEVERMIESGKPVMLYFSNVAYRTRDVDFDQIAQLSKFKTSIQKNALTEEYDERHEFKEKLAHQLDIQVLRWFCSTGSVDDRSIGNLHQSSDNEKGNALLLYQATLKEQLGNINLSGSPAIESFSVRLKDTFVSLTLSGTSHCETRGLGGAVLCEGQPEGRDTTPERVMSFVFQHHPLLLVIGDPGSGKTTLLKYYALSSLDHERYRYFGFSEPVMVFYLPLRDLKKSDSGHASLPASLSAWSEKYFLTIPEAFFSNWLDDRPTLVLLDGLDEISNVSDRIAVCDWIDRTVLRFTEARFVVTSRSTGYRKGDGIELEASHLRADIMDFSETQQAEFLHLWFKAAFIREIPLSAEDKPAWELKQGQKADQKAETIVTFLNKPENKSLRTLAGVPLLLQIMAMLWKDREFLPGGRSDLYDAALNYMLDYRDRRRGIYPLLAAKDARRVLSPVSLWMQEELHQDEVGKAEMQLKMQELLDTLYNSLPAVDFCQNLVERAGVLVEYGDREYVFRHKSFREYMAGVQLLKNLHRPGHLDSIVTHFGDDWWQEPLRFFIGQLDDAEVFDTFMQKLFDSPVTEILTQKQQDFLITLIQEAPQRKIHALQTKLFDTETTSSRQRYLQECLRATGKQEALDAVREFANKGQVNSEIDKLGAHYILIKGGTYPYSLTKKSEPVQDIYVAKYTVTNQLYGKFINYLASKEDEFTGMLTVETYKKKLLELTKGIKGFRDYLKDMNELASRFCSDSADDKRFNKDEQPVVGISWYAARSYCLWLSLIESGGANDHLYRLPTEIEWEYAAGGEESRTYPWGDQEPSSTRANYNENEGATTPVGRYPEGATPEGLYDMAGNVWEWMDNWYDNDKSARSLRGGSWVGNSDYLRCSARYWGNPDNWVNYIGFRVVRPGHSS